MKRWFLLVLVSVFALSAIAADNHSAQTKKLSTKIAGVESAKKSAGLNEYFADKSNQGRTIGIDQLDDCVTSPINDPLPAAHMGVTVGQGNDHAIGQCGVSGSTAADDYYSFTPTADGFYNFSLCGSPEIWDPVLYIYEGCPENQDIVACNDDACRLMPCLTAELFSDMQYVIVIDGFDTGSEGPYVLTVSQQSPNEPCATNCMGAAANAFCQNAEPLTIGVSVMDDNFFGGETLLQGCNTSIDGCGVWYQVVGTGNVLIAQTCSQHTDFDTKLHVFGGTGCGDLVCLAGNDDSNCQLNNLRSRVEWCSVAGDNYYIFVSGFQGLQGHFELTVRDEGAPCCDQPDVFFSPEFLPFCECLQICSGEIQKIYIGPLGPQQRPVSSYHGGCDVRASVPQGCGEECDPAIVETYMDWVYLPDDQLWCMDIYAIEGGCYCFCVDRVLPVEMQSFDANAGDASVALSWRTASETDLARFEVMRDGTKIAELTAQNSPVGASYSFLDYNLENGRTYTYQLVAVDFSGVSEVVGTESQTPQVAAAVITEFALHQNFPNPFNPTTEISFDLPNSEFVTLAVYNLTGQRVAELLNTNLAAGRHTVSFSADNMASGVYLYNITAGSFSAHKKMILMR